MKKEKTKNINIIPWTSDIEIPSLGNIRVTSFLSVKQNAIWKRLEQE